MQSPSVVVVVVVVMVMVVVGFGNPVPYQVPVSVVVVGDLMPYQVPLIVVVELAVEAFRVEKGSFVVLVLLQLKMMRKSSKMRTMNSMQEFHEVVVRRLVPHGPL